MVTQENHLCWLCGKEADLRACKIDEHGMVVHESCYVLQTALNTGSTQVGLEATQPSKARRRSCRPDPSL